MIYLSAIGWVTRLVERKLLAAPTTSVTFSGLDGDADKLYFILGSVKNATALDAYLTLRPNGITTNQETKRLKWDPAVSSGTTSDLRISNLEINGEVQFTTWFWAAKLVSGATRRRFMQSSVVSYAAVTDGREFAGVWNETATNVTSLDIVSVTANAMDTGSEITLYRVEQG